MAMFQTKPADDPDAIRSCRTMTKGCFYLSMLFMLVAQLIVNFVGTGTVNMWDSNRGNTTTQGFDTDWTKTPFSLDVTNCVRMQTSAIASMMSDTETTPEGPSRADIDATTTPLIMCSDNNDCKQGDCIKDGKITVSTPSNKCDDPTVNLPEVNTCIFKSLSETDPCKKLTAQLACFPKECCVEAGITGSAIKFIETTAASLPGCTPLGHCGANGFTFPNPTSDPTAAASNKCDNPNNVSPGATKCVFKSSSETDPCKKLDQIACYPKECCVEAGITGSAIKFIETTAASLPGCTIRKCGAEGNTFASATSQNGMCINDIEQSETSKITGSTQLTDCFPWSFVERSKPFIGAFWAFFLMYMGVSQFAFGNCQWRAKHPGFFLFVLIATAYVVYDIHMVYNKMFYDTYMKLVDCSDVDDIHLAFARKKYLKLIGKVCYAYNEKIPSDQLKSVIGVNSHSDFNAGHFIFLFKTFNAGIVMAWISIVLSVIGILFSPYLQVSDCGCPVCSGAVHEPAKIKKKEGGGGGGSVIIGRNNGGIQGGGGARVVATDSVAATDAAVEADAELELSAVPRPNPFVADNNPFSSV